MLTSCQDGPVERGCPAIQYHQQIKSTAWEIPDTASAFLKPNISILEPQNQGFPECHRW
jgi:hypothetical protein